MTTAADTLNLTPTNTVSPLLTFYIISLLLRKAIVSPMDQQESCQGFDRRYI